MSAVTQNVISLSSVYLRGRTFLISVFLILIHLDLRHAFAVQWEVKNFPNPQTDLQDCGRRGKQSFVCDPDGVLSYSEGNCMSSGTCFIKKYDKWYGWPRSRLSFD